jgi:oligoribonuclease
MTDRLVWIDCEMTGLDLRRDALVEIACMITDGELNMLDEGIDLVIKPPPEAITQMSDVVREMHTASGLLGELASGVTLAEAQQQVIDYVRGHGPEPRKLPLCGNSIATDRSFLARDMPDLDSFLHYRMVDVSGVKELVRRWYPRVYFASPEKKGGHRALADIIESILELRYYRAAVFVARPGPDSSTARELAKMYVAGSAVAAHPPGPVAAPTAAPPAAGDGIPPDAQTDANTTPAAGTNAATGSRPDASTSG